MVRDNLSPLSGGRIKCLLILVIAAIATSGGAGQAWAQPAATTTTLAVASGGSAATTLTSGSVVTLTATVLAGTTPVTVGQVNFCNAAATHCTDINVLATAQITSAGTAVFKFRPGVGSHTYKAVFLGTPNGAKSYAGSSSGTAALTVTGLWSSITTFAASPSGDTFNLTATVGGNASTAPTGTVSFLNYSNGNAVLGTASLGKGTAGPSFLNVTNSELETVSWPLSIAVGDFNGDGIPDLVVANPSADTVTVLLGNGDGTFTIKSTPQTGNAPWYVAVADFNGDGILDLAVANAGGNSDGTVTILLGNGDGTFTAAASSPATGIEPLSIAVGDFNGDGIPDLAVANYQGNSVTILLGNGDGTFTATATSPPTGSFPYSIAVGDFNGDGIPDLAVVNGDGNNPSTETNGTVTILMGNGDGTFTATTTSPATALSPYFVAVGDFNGDGIPDLVVANYDSNNLFVLLGNGDGTFTTAASPATGDGPEAIAVGDFNGDGIPDLVVPNYSDGTLTVLLGKGDGTFSTEATVPAGGGGPMAVAADDFNGDGVPDVAISVYGSAPDAIYDGGLLALLTANYTATATDTFVLPSGTEIQQVFAFYAGDDNYSASISGATIPGTGQMTPTVTVTPASSSITAAQVLTVTVAVYGGTGSPTATGSLTLTSGSYNSGAITLSGGSAQINIPAGSLAIGSDTLTVNYTPDASSSTVYTSASGTSTVAVTLVTPTVTVTPASPNTTPFQSLTVTVSLSGAAGSPVPTGTVTLASGSYASSAATLSSGTASITIPAGALSLGTDTLTASYTPDSASSNLYTGATGSSSVAVNTMTPTVNLSPALKSLLISQALSVVVAVSGPSGGPSPTGSVMLTSGSYTSVATTLSSGSATINIPAYSLSTGSDTLTASYTPDSSSSSNYNSASGTSSAVTVAKTTPTVTVTPSSSSITAAQGLTVTVVVSGGTGSPTATGSVTLTSGSYTSVATTLSSGSAAINIPADSLSTGSVTLTASYSPDSSSPDYTGASGTSKVFVSSMTPTVTVTPLAATILSTQALQVNISVSGPSGDPTPTGSVTLTSGSYDSSSVTLSDGSAAINILAGSLSPGNDTLSVSYTPDSASIATYSSATGSSSVAVTAPNPSPVVGSISPAVQSAGSAAFTLTVNGSGFISGSTVYWGASALTTQFGSAAQITAQVPASDIESSATEPISVENPSPGGGISNTLQFEVDSSGAGSPSFAVLTATVPPGQSATYSVTLPSAATAVTASCLNLPSGASCSFSSSAGTVTIATSSTTPAGTYQVTMVFTATVPGAASSFVLLPILLLPLLLVRRKWTAANIGFTACLGLVLMAAAAGVGCGSGAAGAPPVAPTHEVTTAGAVTLTVQ